MSGKRIRLGLCAIVIIIIIIIMIQLSLRVQESHCRLSRRLWCLSNKPMVISLCPHECELVTCPTRSTRYVLNVLTVLTRSEGEDTYGLGVVENSDLLLASLNSFINYKLLLLFASNFFFENALNVITSEFR